MLGHYLQSALLRLDGWANDLTGLGTAALDKTVVALFSRATQRSDEYLGQLYEDDPLARRIADKVPDEMLRAGYDLLMGSADDAQQLATAARDKLKALQADERIKDGLVWERVYGGSAVFIGADDGSTNPAEPLQESRLRDVTHLTVVDKSQLTAAQWYPATDARAGRPMTWLLTPLSTTGAGPVEVHESRLLIFPGGRVTQQRRIALEGWGQSVLRAVHDILRDYNMSWQGVTHMLQSANQDVWYMSGLKNAMSSGTPGMREYFASRFRMAQMNMGPNRGVALDADGEKFERHASQLTGVPETLQQAGLRLSSATDMPMTVLFGMSPAGLNATGESDLQLWNTAVAAMQCERLQPQLERLVRLLMLCKEGPTRGKEVDGWAIKFRPLKHLDDQQAADLRSKQAAVDKIYIDAQVLLPEEVALARFRPDGYSTETSIDLDARRAILDAELERAVEEAEDPPPPPPQFTPQLPPGEPSGAPAVGDDDNAAGDNAQPVAKPGDPPSDDDPKRGPRG